MHKYNTHVCIVSDQPIPNYIPVLDKDFRPQEVILLTTEKMQQNGKAAALAKTMKERCGAKVHTIAIAGEYDMQEMEDKVLTQLLERGEDKEQIALNLTGGTKLMAIAAYTTFRDAGYPTFYFTATSNEVLLLEKNERITLQPQQIRLEDYLQLHGYPVSSANNIARSVPPGRQKIGETLAIAPERFADALTVLNGDISAAIENNSNTLDILLRKPTVKNLDGLLHLFEKENLLTRSGNRIRFTDKDARTYINGGWLEEYVFNEIKKIAGIQDIALNVEIQNAQKGITQNNELDIAFLHHNALYVLECKTKNYNNKSEGQAQNELYKLETLKKLGGLRTQTAFVSYRELKAHVRDRAKGADIKILENKDLAGLRKTIENWITAKNR